MVDRNIMRLCLALAASLLFHALLLGTRQPAIDDSKVVLAARNSLTVNVIQTAKPGARHQDIRQKATSKRPNSMGVRKIQKPLVAEEQKTTSEDKAKEPAPEPSINAGKNPAQAIGTALQNMLSQQYLMMRLQQFFSISRENASRIIRSRFTPDEMAQYQGKRCTLRLVAAHAPEQGFEITQPECDDPDLATGLRAVPWNTAMPLPSEYSLPYRGMIIYLNVGRYDVSIGLEPIVN